MNTSSINFYSDKYTEVLRISKDGITANPDVPVDEAAKLVLAAIESNIKTMVQKAAEDEREACAKVAEAQENKVVRRHPSRIEFDPDSMMARKCAAAIRARKNHD